MAERYFGTDLVDLMKTILIIVGSDIVPEEKDRPLAYKLKEEIKKRGRQDPFKKGIVLSDLWYLQNVIFHTSPTIAVGGPGVNALCAQIYQELPAALSLEKKYFIQMDTSFKDYRVAIWGMNQKYTEEAVEAFINQGYLDQYLKAIWKEEKVE